MNEKTTSALLIRLDNNVFDKLKDLSKKYKKPMNSIVRQSVREFIVKHKDVEYDALVIDNDKQRGKVYIVENKAHDIKIKSGIHPKARIKQMEVYANINIINEYISNELDDYKDVENKMHIYFKKFNIHGNWFSCSFSCAVERLKLLESV